MNNPQKKVYIAGPFFNQVELEFVQEVEFILESAGIQYFSPRSEGVLIEMKDKEKAAALERIYQSNIDNICECNTMIAIIDGRDPGTIFEIGYMTALKDLFQNRKIITITNQDFGMNVMICQSVDAHLRSTVHLFHCAIFAVGGSLNGKQFMEDRGEAW